MNFGQDSFIFPQNRPIELYKDRLMMKVLLLNTFDSGGGAAVASSRLYQGLKDIGIESRMLVQHKYSDDPNVIAPASKLGKGISLIRPELDAIPLRFYPKRQKIIFSPAVVPDSMASKMAALDPDIVHLHWIAGGFIRLESLKIFNKPIVWTLHDSWAFTGGCHIPFDCKRYQDACGMCPALGSKREKDLSHWIWRRKKKAWKDLNLTIVTPSRWLADCARSSSLLSNYRIEVIPNGMDIGRFKPMHKQYIREILSLPKDKKIILFGSVNCLNDRIKGFHLLLPALRKMSAEGWADKAELVIFGASEPQDAPDCGLETRYFGTLRDDISLRVLYNAADVMVVPSLQEAFGQTASEAMACGTPVVAFGTTGLLDIVDHQQNGYLARPFEIEDLSQGIAWVLKDDKRWQILSQQARQKVEKEFDIRLVAQRYLDLYNEIIE